MINILVSDLNTHTVARLIRTSRGKLPGLRLVTYRQAFRRLALPEGPIIFTDFDLLSSFEMDAIGQIARAAETRDPPVPVLNNPLQAKERFALLHALHGAGLNPVRVTRLDTGDRPTRYPVFLRLEDGCLRPDTGLLEDEPAYDAALAGLRRDGKTLKRRIAVSFEAARDGDGYFRKYGAFRVGDRIIPQHILRDRDWIVKSNRAHVDEAFAAEELAFIRDNPHEAQLRRIFDLAGVTFGRIDYTVIGDAIVTFEINMNPTFPRFRGGNPARETRRAIILQRLQEAFEAVDATGSGGSPLRFDGNPKNLAMVTRRRWSWLDRQMMSLRLKTRRGRKETTE